MSICKFWNEYDNSKGQLFEYCKLIQKKCYCCGALKQCNFKYKCMPVRSFFNRLINKIRRR